MDDKGKQRMLTYKKLEPIDWHFFFFYCSFIHHKHTQDENDLVQLYNRGIT